MAMPMNREQAPDVWWSPELGLAWSEDGGHTFRRTEAGRVVEFFHLPPHATAFDSLGTFSSGCCCGEC